MAADFFIDSVFPELQGDSEADRLLSKFFALMTIRDLSNQTLSAFLPDGESKLRKENLRLQNAKLRHELPMNDDEYGEGTPSSLTALFATKGAHAVPRPRFIEQFAVPSVFGMDTDQLHSSGRRPPNVRSIASKLFLRR